MKFFVSNKKFIFFISTVIILISVVFFILENHKDNPCVFGMEPQNFNEMKANFKKAISLTEFKEKDFNFLVWRDFACTYDLISSQQEKEELAGLFRDVVMGRYNANSPLSREKVFKNRVLDFVTNFVSEDFQTFFMTLAYGDLKKVCPDILPAQCLAQKKENPAYIEEPDEWCKSICQTMESYDADKNQLSLAMNEFKDPAIYQRYQSSISGFLWRETLIWRFLGEDSANEYCRALPASEAINGISSRDLCLLISGRFMPLDTIKADCAVVKKEVFEAICPE